MRRSVMVAVAMGLLLAGGAQAASKAAPGSAEYRRVVQETAGMVSDAGTRRLAAKHGLQVLNVTWEDTGRYKGSSVGPNISDMTIQVQQKNPDTDEYDLTLMPVIRFPNFSDKTGDLSPEDFHLLVGNEDGGALRRVDLATFLKDVPAYLHDPSSWKARNKSLFAPGRDSHVLVSAQACFLPVPKEGIAEFNPVLFNYQSYEGDPAVLTILVTREGTSVTVIDNKRDGFDAGGTWGQRLFFNKNGERASFTGTRLSDFASDPATGNGNAATAKAAGQEGLNMVLLIQVPLKQKQPMRSMLDDGVFAEAAPNQGFSSRSGRSDVEQAVIGHGEVEGPFTEIDGLEIERDDRFPVRVTVQFYKATSNGVVGEKDMAEIAAQIAKVYDRADYVGSLVVEGETGRPTEYWGDKQEPPDWWASFWARHEKNTGLTVEATMEILRALHGPDWTPASRRELTREIRALRRVRADAR